MAHHALAPSPRARASNAITISAGSTSPPPDCSRQTEAEHACVAQLVEQLGREHPLPLDLHGQLGSLRSYPLGCLQWRLPLPVRHVNEPRATEPFHLYSAR